MNIPARYCTGYLGDIGVPPVPDPMDFSAWFEVYLGGHWYTFDARHNQPRIGRILMATGRDATDVALSTSFGAVAARRLQGGHRRDPRHGRSRVADATGDPGRLHLRLAERRIAGSGSARRPPRDRRRRRGRW